MRTNLWTQCCLALTIATLPFFGAAAAIAESTIPKSPIKAIDLIKSQPQEFFEAGHQQVEKEITQMQSRRNSTRDRPNVLTVQPEAKPNFTDLETWMQNSPQKP